MSIFVCFCCCRIPGERGYFQWGETGCFQSGESGYFQSGESEGFQSGVTSDMLFAGCIAVECLLYPEMGRGITYFLERRYEQPSELILCRSTHLLACQPRLHRSHCLPSQIRWQTSYRKAFVPPLDHSLSLYAGVQFLDNRGSPFAPEQRKAKGRCRRVEIHSPHVIHSTSVGNAFV